MRASSTEFTAWQHRGASPIVLLLVIANFGSLPHFIDDTHWLHPQKEAELGQNVDLGKRRSISSSGHAG